MTVLPDVVLWYRFARPAYGGLFYPLTVLRLLQSLAGTVQAVAITWVLAGVVRGHVGYRQLGLLAACLVATMGLQAVLGHLTTLLKERLQSHVNRELLDLVTDIPTVEYCRHRAATDRMDYLMRETWRTVDTAWAPVDLAITVANLALVLVLVVRVHPALALVPLLGLTRVLGSVASSRRISAALKAASVDFRRSRLLGSLATAPEHTLEFRVYGAGRTILSELEQADRRALAAVTRQRRIAGWLDLAGRMSFSAVYGAVLVLLGYRAAGLTAGQAASTLILLITLMARIERVSSGLASGGGQLSQLMFFLREMEAFRDHSRSAAGPLARPATAPPGVTVDRAWLRHPNQKEPALCEVSLRIPAGAVVAIVGRNGAGKTTLVEMILGLYRPSGGRVRLGRGAAYSHGGDHAPAEPASTVSASLQDGARFEFSLRDAVVLDRTAGAPGNGRLWAALAEADADELARDLPAGLDTVLGGRFRGARQLSGGQWQRVANAAALFPAHPDLLVLDEPTSAVDPRVEEATLRSLLTGGRRIATAGGVALIVSHRLALTKDVDVIVVLDRGRVVEVGSHDELMAGRGGYARMYTSQLQMYR